MKSHESIKGPVGTSLFNPTHWVFDQQNLVAGTALMAVFSTVPGNPGLWH